MKSEIFTNRLFCMDNLELLKNLPDESIDLVFCDILYNTGKTFDDYEDKLGNAIEAMEWYEPRLKEMWRVLKSTGAVYLHCNYRLIHYLRVELDKVFGIDSFRNEIIWNQGSWKNISDKKLQSAHESMLFYAKPGHEVNRNIADIYTDVWTLEALNQNDKYHEKVGYEGQKPIEYVKRVISISSRPGDLVADFFLGSGTTCVAAKQMGRNYLGCDINPRSIKLTKERMETEDYGNVLHEDPMTNLYDCPPGLCYAFVDGKKQLCMKTEYFHPHGGGVEAYIVSSGEILSCNGLSETEEGCRKITAIPVVIKKEKLC